MREKFAPPPALLFEIFSSTMVVYFNFPSSLSLYWSLDSTVRPTTNRVVTQPTAANNS